MAHRTDCRAETNVWADLVTFLGQELSANSKIDKDNKAYVTGAMDLNKIQVSK